MKAGSWIPPRSLSWVRSRSRDRVIRPDAHLAPDPLRRATPNPNCGASAIVPGGMARRRMTGNVGSWRRRCVMVRSGNVTTRVDPAPRPSGGRRWIGAPRRGALERRRREREDVHDDEATTGATQPVVYLQPITPVRAMALTLAVLFVLGA